MKVAVRINRRAEGIMIVILIITTTLISFSFSHSQFFGFLGNIEYICQRMR